MLQIAAPKAPVVEVRKLRKRACAPVDKLSSLAKSTSTRARHLSPFAGSSPSLPSTPLLYHKNPRVSRKKLKKFYKKA